MTTIAKMPLLSTGFGPKVMDKSGKIWNRVANTTAKTGNYIICGETVETIQDGKKRRLPVIIPNNVFTDENGTCFIRAKEDNEASVRAKAKAAGCAYIIARETGAEAWMDGKQISFPTTLWNEMGVAYHFVDFKTYGYICKETHGYYMARKVEPIYLLNAKEGEAVQAVVNGVKEHETVLKKGEVKVQNMYHGETYKMKLKNLFRLYTYSETTPEGIQIWKPKDEEQMWTFTKENIFGILWGGFEFLAKAMINITDHDDIYGCNFEVFNGTDLAKGSHVKTKLFLPMNPQNMSREISSRVQAGYALPQEAIPKTVYVEVPFPLDYVS